MGIWTKVKRLLGGHAKTENGSMMTCQTALEEGAPTEFIDSISVSHPPTQASPATETVQLKGKTQYQRFLGRMAERERAKAIGARNKVYREPLRGRVPIEKVPAIKRFCRGKSKQLFHKRRLLLVRDDYGKTDVRPWFAEVDRFIDQVLPVKIRPKNESQRRQIRKIVIAAVNSYKPTKAEANASDPLDFELKCADIFKNAGWKATTTKRSNDQGVDVLAEKGDQTIVLQCKFHGRPIGNKAVQEIYAGAKFRAATTAVVVSKSGFTSSAK
jgi:hypothetical protein